MKITKEELNRLLAEKVMGWHQEMFVDGVRYWFNIHRVVQCQVDEWNPLADANHALQVLEAYCKESQRDADILFEGDKYDVDITSYEDQGCGCCYADVIWGNACKTTLSEAVCLAVAEAVTGNKYELED